MPIDVVLRPMCSRVNQIHRVFPLRLVERSFIQPKWFDGDSKTNSWNRGLNRKTPKVWNSNLVAGVMTMSETLWICDQVRFGQLYNRMMFDTKAEAEQFVQRMKPMEPDQQFSIEAIEAYKIWN
jgi:hypothetical protein